MKKVLCTVAALFCLLSATRADEGMWLIPLLKQMNAQAMSDLGCRLTPEQIYSINNSSLKDAIVQFGSGCTGEIISNEGLLVTNHHCGYSSIQGLSSPEHNYLEDGYWAMTRDKELPVPGLSVTFMESMTDVTDILQNVRNVALKRYKNKPEKVEDAVKQASKKMVEDAQDQNPGTTATITGFYNDNVQYLIVYKIYRDVRFVGAPPVSLGKFGGDTDNWEWPRHTCDFSMFRVYAGKDNQPASYSPDNLPYVPKQALKVSLKGVNDGDFAMVMGYPGRTQRFQTADQLESMMYQYGVAVKARTARQNEMMKGMESDPAIRLKYANKYASSSNAWKKWQGEQLSFDKLKVIEREREKEARFMQWVAADKSRQEKYGNALQEISEAVAQQRQPSYDRYVLSESIGRIGPLSVYSSFISAFKGELSASKDSVKALAKGFESAMEYFKDYDVQTEKDIALAMLEFYREYADKSLYFNEIGDFATMDFAAFVDDVFGRSPFASAENMEKAKNYSISQLESDPVAILTRAATAAMTELSIPITATRAALEEGSKIFTAGLLEWTKDKASYPDANFTMRLTYGNVKSYSPKDGVIYKHYTTLGGVIEKEDPSSYEFRVPAKIKELYNNKDYGQYANAAGELPTCFLTNCDITGGNSGSPVLDADGSLIGLAFDGNWESMSSDVMFEPDLQRCICVDIRYVLFVLDKYGNAGHLLREMDLVK